MFCQMKIQITSTDGNLIFEPSILSQERLPGTVSRSNLPNTARVMKPGRIGLRNLLRLSFGTFQL